MTGIDRAADRHRHRRQPVYPVATSYTPPQTNKAIRNFGGEACGGTLFDDPAGVVQLGVRRDGHRDHRARQDDRRGAESFGFNAKAPIDLPDPAAVVLPHRASRTTCPRWPSPRSARTTCRPRPLQMAWWPPTVANGGRIMKPHVMTGGPRQRGLGHRAVRRCAVAAADQRRQRGDHAPGHDRRRPARHRHRPCRSPATRSAARPAPPSSAPTRRASHTWIIGFAGPPGASRQIAVAVVVLNQPGRREATGGRVAAPIAKQCCRPTWPTPTPATPATDSRSPVPRPPTRHVGGVPGVRGGGPGR